MIKLVPMSQQTFDENVEAWIASYAEEKAKAGNWKPEESLDLSRAEFGKLLPNGIATKDHFVLTIMETENKEDLGMLWFSLRNEGELPGAFIWEFSLHERYRGRGYSKVALQELDKMLHDMGIKRVSLHVFGHNAIARSLYEKMGYETTNVVMAKEIK